MIKFSSQLSTSSNAFTPFTRKLCCGVPLASVNISPRESNSPMPEHAFAVDPCDKL